MRPHDDRPAPDVGDAAPTLRGTTIDGDEFELEALRGRCALVSFLRHAG